MNVGRFATVNLVLVSLFAVALLFALETAPEPYLFGIGGLADLSGFLALGLIAATGIMMLFKGRLTSRAGSPERLWRLHIIIAGIGGFFLGIHVVLFLAFPISLPVLLGYAGTGAALFVWITGSLYFQGARNSMFLHGVFSIGAVFLFVVHTFGAGRNIPVVLSGLSLAFAALAMLAGVAWKIVAASRSEKAQAA